MSEDKSKLQLIGEIIQADNKNLELIEELNQKEDEIERLNYIIKESIEYIESRARKAGVELMPREIELLEILNKGE